MRRRGWVMAGTLGGGLLALVADHGIAIALPTRAIDTAVLSLVHVCVCRGSPVPVWTMPVDRVPLIGSLLGPCSPPAIARFVIAVYVDAVDGQALAIAAGYGPNAKGRVVVPLRANADTATAVVFEIVARFVGAAPPHFEPSPVQADPAPHATFPVDYDCSPAASLDSVIGGFPCSQLPLPRGHFVSEYLQHTQTHS